jgi:hypothetical protein
MVSIARGLGEAQMQMLHRFERMQRQNGSRLHRSASCGDSPRLEVAWRSSWRSSLKTRVKFVASTNYLSTSSGILSGPTTTRTELRRSLHSTYTVRKDFGLSDVDHRHHNCLALSFFAFLCSLALTLLSRRSANSSGEKTMSAGGNAMLSSPCADGCVARKV